MLITKKNRREVYKYLFQEGVLFAEKDFNLAEHPEIPGIPNLQVIKLMQSFKSKELVTERFAWRHYYWFLTDKGIEYLREFLNLPEEIVPSTLKKSTRNLERGDRAGQGAGRQGQVDGQGQVANLKDDLDSLSRGRNEHLNAALHQHAAGGPPGGRFSDRPRRDYGDREGYRSGPPREGGFGGFGRGGAADKAGAPGDYNPQFSSGGGGGGGFGRGAPPS